MGSNYVVPQQGLANNDQTEAADLAAVQNQNSQVNIAPLDAYSGPTTMSSTSDSSQAPNGSQAAFVAGQPPKPLPKVGEHRCYWALLSAGLDFIYLDPVLQSHLEAQASLLVGKSLLDFVHPDERASAEEDLGNVLESKTLHGSVTRVRYSRLSRVRYQLGHRTSVSPWEEADKIALDSNYMAVDVVINWAADGLVLCFLHAVTDLTPNDNDEHHKSQWTNWCGTPWMGTQQIELLYQRLLVCIPQTTNPSRVFQILSNEDEKSLMLTWPPDQGQGRDYAKLVEAVNIRPTEQTGAKTSCTRRYKALQNMPMGETESIIVPHGTIVFACHKVTAPSRPSPTSMQQMGYNANNFVSPQQNQQYYDQSGNAYPNTPPYSSSAPPYNQSYPSQPPYPAQHWPEGTDPLSSLAPPPTNMRSSSYPPQQQWPNQPYMDPSQAYPPRTSTPDYGYAPGTSNEGGSSSTTNDVVPPPRRRVSPGIPGTTRETHGGRSSGNRPMGIQKCTSCKATQSPEWRKGPSGKKELCNACGLRYARSRAKKEGTALASHRKRKDKGHSVTTKRESATPSPINGSYSASRRNGHDEISLSGGSASGSEVHSHSGHAAMEGVTPSPSPPASNTSFVHYAHPNGAHQRNSQMHSTDLRSSYPNANSFYSVPSPLSNSSVHQSQHNNHSSQLSAIRMDSSYSRMSTSTSTPASYERERDKDRELPPTPVSTESRLSSARSILMLQH